MVDAATKSRLEKAITSQDAFTTMQHFLQEHWERLGRPTDSLSDLLSFSSRLTDGGTADPAILQDWLRIAESVIRGERGPIVLELKRPEK
jgi:hypothetical protein